jgi:hypothetical protein
MRSWPAEYLRDGVDWYVKGWAGVRSELYSTREAVNAVGVADQDHALDLPSSVCREFESVRKTVSGSEDSTIKILLFRTPNSVVNI